MNKSRAFVAAAIIASMASTPVFAKDAAGAVASASKVSAGLLTSSIALGVGGAAMLCAAVCSSAGHNTTTTTTSTH